MTLSVVVDYVFYSCILYDGYSMKKHPPATLSWHGWQPTAPHPHLTPPHCLVGRTAHPPPRTHHAHLHTPRHTPTHPHPHTPPHCAGAPHHAATPPHTPPPPPTPPHLPPGGVYHPRPKICCAHCQLRACCQCPPAYPRRRLPAAWRRKEEG